MSFGAAQGLGVGAAAGFAGAFLGPAFGRRRVLAVRRAGADSMDGEEVESSQTLAIVGLGNVGAQFDGTRHNIGFAAVDEVASKLLSTDRWALSGSIWQEAFGGTVLRLKRTASKEMDSYEEILLFKPSSMMNGSGRPVSELVSSLGLPESALVVIYDDMDLDVGRLRLRKSGSAGGQNGVKSILNHGFQKFLRLRLGVSRPKSGGREAIVGHVLGKFRHEEALSLASVLPNPSPVCFQRASSCHLARFLPVSVLAEQNRNGLRSTKCKTSLARMQFSRPVTSRRLL